MSFGAVRTHSGIRQRADQQEMCHHVLDRAAYFNGRAVTNRQQPNVPSATRGYPNSLAGVHVHVTVLIRVNDSAGDLLPDMTLPPVEPLAESTSGITYLYVHTSAEPETTGEFSGWTAGSWDAGVFRLFYVDTSENITIFLTNFVAEGPQRLKRRHTVPIIGKYPLTHASYPAVGGTAAFSILCCGCREFHLP
jgi:hypothetical protein